MLKKRALAFMLSACMVATTVGGNVSAAELGAGTVSGNVSVLADNSTVSSNDMDGSSVLTVSSNDNKAAEGVIDFEDESIGNWGMKGDMADSVSIADDGTGNKYLRLKRDKASTRSAVKEFDTPAAMSTAAMSFKWYTTSQKSDSGNGYSCIRLMDAGSELVSLYFNDIRDPGKSAYLFYSVNGFDSKKETGKTVSNGGVYDVAFTFDFVSHTVKITFEGEEIVSVPFNEDAVKVNQFAFVGAGTLGSGKAFATDMGIDDFSFTYEENSDVDEQAISALASLSDVIITKKDWEAGYKHPETVEATLLNDEKLQVAIDADSWTSTPTFDPAKKGWYTWTADIVAPTGHANPKKLQVSYKMAYKGDAVSSHDYEEDFTFEIWPQEAWGKPMGGDSGTGSVGLSHVQDADGNYYMKASASEQGGSRGSRFDLNSDIIKGASVQFDWMPVSVSSTASAQLMFIAPDSWNSYFTLKYDSNGNITAFTKCPLGSASTIQTDFEGAIDQSNPIVTGLSGFNKWYTVQLDFNYVAHTADLAIYEKGQGTAAFTKADIPIDAEANGIRSMAIILARNGGKVGLDMGLDNITIDYDELTAGDIASVEKLADVKVAKVVYDKFQWPEEVAVELGDGSSAVVKLGEWKADPAFDENTEGDYVWSAELITGELENPFNLKASFTMTYTLLPYPTFANNPKTLELEFGEALTDDMFPEHALVFLSDGSSYDMPIDKWEPIREFNAAEEGIYVYGANLVAEEGKTQIVRDALLKNENQSDKDTYKYDVYFRISYFKSQDNYNAYQRSMEYLDRGVYAVAGEGGIFVSWRLLVTEYGENIGFNVYRNGELVNASPITTRTNFVDADGKVGDVYTVAKIQNGIKTESEPCVATQDNYKSIPLQRPEPQPSKTGEMATYSINDAGVADVDGDGQYEIIVKWYPSNAFDSGKAVKPSSPTIFDVYEMDGTALWRLNMGLEMPSGAHFNQFMLYDLDEDGKAELLMKTSDGTVSYKPNAEGKFDMTDASTIVSYIGDKSVVPGTNINSNGHANSGSNEYITVFEGQTGEEIDTIDYVNTTGDFTDWGTSGGKNDSGNRSARYNIAVAYLPKTKEAGCTQTIPAVLFNRGYYDKTTVAAYTLRDNGDGSRSIQMEWNFVAENGTQYAGKGNHNLSTGDLDNDGFDELVMGALAIDHDGSVLWVKDGKDGQDKAGHADSIHLAAMSPDTNQLYVFAPQEDTNSTLNCYLTNASNGSRIGGYWVISRDIGRGVAANITPAPGYEYWAGIPNNENPETKVPGSIYNFYGDVVAVEKPENFSTNWCMYWDGDLLSELVDGHNPGVGEDTPTVFKYNWVENTLDTVVSFDGTKMNNSTKNNPSLTADLFGDWREEIMVPSKNNDELRIYMTTEETDYMIYTLMHDPVYRNGVANQNTSYNQPPHPGFYLGEDIADEVLAMELPKANIAYTTDEKEGEVDKDALKAEVDKAGALKESDYTAASWAEFKKALDEAVAELASKESTPASVAARLDALRAAAAALEKASGGEDPEPGKPDTSKLKEAADKASALDPSKYTKESYAAMKAALDAALAVLADENASQDAVDKALEALNSAVGALAAAEENEPSGDDSSDDNNQGGSDEGGSGNDSGNDNGGADSNRTSPKTGQEGDFYEASPLADGAAWYIAILAAAAVLLISGVKFFLKASGKEEE